MSEAQFSYRNARAMADKVVDALTPYCDCVEIAGSIRRRRPWIGDIDIVVLPKPGEREQIIGRCSKTCSWLKGGEQYQVFLLPNGMQLDLWFAHHSITEERDMLGEVTRAASPTNFGSLMICRTGSKEHNIYLASRALKLGLNWQPHQGVMQAGRCIASVTEESVFAALQLDFIEPVRRER